VPTDGLRFHNAAQLIGYVPSDHFSAREEKTLDRFAQLAAVAAREGIEDSGILLTNELRQRTAIIMGSCVGGQTTQDDSFRQLYQDNARRLHCLTVPKIMSSAGVSRISWEHGITGPTFTVNSACSSSAQAIGLAFWMVRSGAVDIAITGGAEAPLSLGLLKAWDSMKVVAPDTCRPFSKGREGTILGEGAATLILEPLDLARSRGSRIYAELLGFGMSSDGYHITQPLADGAAKAITGALSDGNVRPDRVGYINAHGTGTELNDAAETTAIRAVFGDHARNLLVSSTKSMHGHTLGAAGAIEAAATVLALHHGVLPPTINFLYPDPACDLDVIPNAPREEIVDCALSHSFAFGGLNAALAFRRVENCR
jgi:nodulation protein E